MEAAVAAESCGTCVIVGGGLEEAGGRPQEDNSRSRRAVIEQYLGPQPWTITRTLEGDYCAQRPRAKLPGGSGQVLPWILALPAGQVKPHPMPQPAGSASASC